MKDLLLLAFNQSVISSSKVTNDSIVVSVVYIIIVSVVSVIIFKKWFCLLVHALELNLAMFSKKKSLQNSEQL